MLHVACCMLHVACCMLHVTCYMLHVTCYMLHITYYRNTYYILITIYSNGLIYGQFKT